MTRGSRSKSSTLTMRSRSSSDSLDLELHLSQFQTLQCGSSGSFLDQRMKWINDPHFIGLDQQYTGPFSESLISEDEAMDSRNLQSCSTLISVKFQLNVLIPGSADEVDRSSSDWTRTGATLAAWRRTYSPALTSSPSLLLTAMSFQTSRRSFMTLVDF